jgi:uncharacterized protein YlxP (DUF503 family)
MVVGIVQIELIVHDAMTLKDKRRVIRSIKDRIANEFSVSIAEVDAHDLHRKAVLGIALVGNGTQFVRESLDKVIDRLSRFHGASVVDVQIDIV